MELTEEQQLTWDILRDRWGPYYKYIHEDCQGVAFVSEQMPQVGELVTREGVYNIDGSRPKYGERVRCFNCGQQLGYLTLDNFVK